LPEFEGPETIIFEGMGNFRSSVSTFSASIFDIYSELNDGKLTKDGSI
jgi:hypothetical protein